ncbi:MAG TPA: hypothetical protein VK804_08730 [Bradyrhizobium sp.]|jgi:hypothetical protein|uniref:hypothetical protein n=1 Tax=Bradyrhizobium sp. TaxID=376 RepID=UPI002C7AF2FA|nr:hypothetical protein [Bradyrhizobium sp.]HTB00547.1 hypothetical protein [Bradyrhizobium sp.]
MAMRRLLFTAAVLLSGCHAGLAQVSTMGSTAMGLPSTPGTIVTSPLNGPSPFSAATPAGRSRYDAGTRAAGFRSHNAGDGRDLRHADNANRGWHACRAGCFHVSDGWHDRNDATGFRDTYDRIADDRKRDRAIPDAIRAASYIIHDRFSRLEHPGAAAARGAAPAVAFPGSSARTDAIDGAEQYVNARHNHDDNVVDDDAGGRDGTRFSVGDYPLADRHHDDRKHCAASPDRQLLEHRMQLYAGGPIRQWRGFAALNAANSGEPSAWHDTTGHH